MCLYAGCSLGGLGSGWLSQVLRSRRAAVFVFASMTALLTAVYLNFRGAQLIPFYVLCGALGFGSGYWAVFATVASEQFGTNLRATAATTIPNFVRGSLVLVSWVFAALKPAHGVLAAAGIVGAGCFMISFVSLLGLRETFGRDLDYLETV
jgi:hypothetical protein